jgi:hypothetical protein
MSASADLHDVWQTRLPLGIACNHCLHRALLQHDRIDAREGNLRTVDALPLRCTKCGRRAYTAHLFRERRQVKRFMAEYR